MKFKYSKILSTILMFTFFLTMISPAVLAREAPGFELPITVKLSGLPPAGGEDYKIVLKADNQEYPMPEGSEDGIYNLIIRGGSTVELPRISFTSRGVYTYTIYQLSGTNRWATYDDTKYNLVVYVTNASGGGLETTVILYLLGEEGKLGEVVFENNYRRQPPGPDPDPDPIPDPDPTPTPTPTPTPETPVEEQVDAVEIDEEIPEGTVDVQEVEEKIPEEVIIEEEVPQGQAAMPKTGSTPTFIYYGIGAVLVALGIGTGRKRKNK